MENVYLYYKIRWDHKDIMLKRRNNYSRTIGLETSKILVSFLNIQEFLEKTSTSLTTFRVRKEAKSFTRFIRSELLLVLKRNQNFPPCFRLYLLRIFEYECNWYRGDTNEVRLELNQSTSKKCKLNIYQVLSTFSGFTVNFTTYWNNF